MSAVAPDLQQMVTDKLYDLRFDPLGAVLFGFPWGEGELAGTDGPWKWQREAFEAIGKHLQDVKTRFTPFRLARSSGHGIGKSAFISKLIWWGKSCFVDCKVIVTANTKTQLDTKTQPEVAKWFRMAINADDFEVNVASIKVADPEHERTWRCDFIPWSEQNPQAFAGAHNKGKAIIIIMDEASGIPRVIFEVIEGALTDADTIIIFAIFGNPHMSSGPFFDAVFGNMRHRWNHAAIDARTVEGTNKTQIAEWEKDYGEDSDFFRVRVLGLPPRAGSAQYIDMELIQNAQKRRVSVLPDEPLVAGVDFAWGGADDNVIRFRRGADARSIPPIRIKGEFTRDPAVMTGKLADVLTKTYDGQKVAMLFLDSAGIAAPVESRLIQLGFKNIRAVNFGAHSPDARYGYMRDFMWGKLKEFLGTGAIDSDAGLEADLAGPCLVSDKQQRVKLEDKELMKKRGLDSPDDADALALTFAMPVAPPKPKSTKPKQALSAWS